MNTYHKFWTLILLLLTFLAPVSMVLSHNYSSSCENPHASIQRFFTLRKGEALSSSELIKQKLSVSTTLTFYENLTIGKEKGLHFPHVKLSIFKENMRHFRRDRKSSSQ